MRLGLLTSVLSLVAAPFYLGCASVAALQSGDDTSDATPSPSEAPIPPDGSAGPRHPVNRDGSVSARDGGGRADAAIPGTAALDAATTDAGTPNPGDAPTSVEAEGGTPPSTQLHYAAVVVMPPPNGTGNGTVLLPDGSTLDVTGSATAGLQEAITFAAKHGWDMFVYGAGTYSSAGTYNLQAPLLFPSLQGRTFRWKDVDLEFGPAVTDAALVFDSCMMVEVELTGTINAPSANNGVRFEARSGFPLDTLLGLAPGGVTASRFEFGHITSLTNGILFSTDPGVIGVGNSTFYSGGAPTSGPCTQCFNEYAADVKASHINDTSVSLDPLHPTGVVVLPPRGPLGNPGTVVLPDGTTLDTTGTTTSGIQEAVSYAFANGLDLAVYGRGLQNEYIQQGASGVTYPTNGFYQVDSTISVPPGPGRTMRIYNATLNYGNLNGAAIEIDEASGLEFELTGQIVAGTPKSTGLFLRSLTGPVTSSVFRVGSVLAGWVGIDVEADGNPVSGNYVSMREVLEGQYGFMMRSPSGQPIQSNYFGAPAIHQEAVGGVDFGAFPTSSAAVLGNRFDLFAMANGDNPSVGIDIGGSGNTVYGSADAPIFFEASATGNTLDYLAGADLSGAVGANQETEVTTRPPP